MTNILTVLAGVAVLCGLPALRRWLWRADHLSAGWIAAEQERRRRAGLEWHGVSYEGKFKR